MTTTREVKPIYRGRSGNFFPFIFIYLFLFFLIQARPACRYSRIVARVHSRRRPNRGVTFDFLFIFSLGCAVHITAAHLSRFATTRVMLASSMVGATPQLPPCCIAAGCSPAAEMCKPHLVSLFPLGLLRRISSSEISRIFNCVEDARRVYRETRDIRKLHRFSRDHVSRPSRPLLTNKSTNNPVVDGRENDRRYEFHYFSS